MSSRPFTSRYLVGNVPLLLRPFHTAFSFLFALLILAYARLVYFSSRKEIVGRVGSVSRRHPRTVHGAPFAARSEWAPATCRLRLVPRR